MDWMVPSTGEAISTRERLAKVDVYQCSARRGEPQHSLRVEILGFPREEGVGGLASPVRPEYQFLDSGDSVVHFGESLQRRLVPGHR